MAEEVVGHPGLVLDLANLLDHPGHQAEGPFALRQRLAPGQYVSVEVLGAGELLLVEKGGQDDAFAMPGYFLRGVAIVLWVAGVAVEGPEHRPVPGVEVLRSVREDLELDLAELEVNFALTSRDLVRHRFASDWTSRGLPLQR